MVSSQTEVEVEGRSLTLVGDFDVRSTAKVRDAIYDALGASPDDVVIDLSGVGTIDATALRVLAVASRRAERAGHRLLLRGCSPQVRRMLTLSRLRHLVTVEPVAQPA